MKNIIFILTIASSVILAQGFQCPVPSNFITCDYGPRYALPSAYGWHRGIDYRATVLWTPVEAVEGGNIGQINYQPSEDGGGWYIRVRGDSATWTYMHLFQDGNNPISPDQIYEARWVQLVNPSNGQNNPSQLVPVFIFWLDRQNNIAEKVLSSNDNRWIRWGNGYIIDWTGSNNILSQGAVGNREIVAPSGESGAGPAHLHVGAASDANGTRYDINPLYYIQHQEPNYTCTIISPSVNDIIFHRPSLPEAQQQSERIRVNINSDSGLDLDRAFVYFFNPGVTRVYDDVHRFSKITYGGPPPGDTWENCYPQRIRNLNNPGNNNRGDETRTGIDPVGDRGNDDLYFIGGLNENGFQCNSKLNIAGTGDARINAEARFPDGRKDMVVRVHSIRYNFEDRYFDVERQIIIDNFAPYIQNLKITQGGIDPVYEKFWPNAPINPGELGLPLVAHCDTLARQNAAELTITFSEAMNRTQIPDIRFITQSDGIERSVVLQNNHWLDDQHFITTIPANSFSDALNDFIIVQVSAYDPAGNMLDANPYTIACRNSSGTFDRHEMGADVNHAFPVGHPGTRVYVSAHDNRSQPKGQPIDTLQGINDPLYLLFTRKINRATLNNQSVLFDPPLHDSLEVCWLDDSSATITASNSQRDFEYSRKYRVTVKGTIRDIRDSCIDGDGNGLPGGDDTSRLITPTPKFTFPQRLSFFAKGQSDSFKTQLNNQEKRKLKYRLIYPGSLDGSNGKWKYHLLYFQQMAPDTSYRDIYVDSLGTDTTTIVKITNLGYTGNFTMTFTALAYDSLTERYLDTMIASPFINTCIGSTPPGGGSAAGSLTWPGGEAGRQPIGPDDNWSISDPIYTSPWLVDTDAPVGVVMSPYSEAMGSLLGKYGIRTALVNADDLGVLSATGRALNDLKTLVIPTGGLRDKENDFPYWQKLSQFVLNGGNLMVMDQPFGHLYSRLPGNPQARGWEEDLSCTGYFTRLGGWHPAMAGQKYMLNNFQTDGYFTWLPPGAQVITRRQLRGGAASTVVYPYGQGRVTLSTCYTDFGIGGGQWHQDGGSLIRDLVTYGLTAPQDEPLTEYNYGNAVNVSVTAANGSGNALTANRAVLTARDPYRRVWRQQEFPVSLAPGASIALQWSGWNLPPAPSPTCYIDSVRGFWQVECGLFHDSAAVQDPRVVNIFALKDTLIYRSQWEQMPPNPYFITMFPGRTDYVTGDTAIFRMDAGNNTAAGIEAYITVTNPFLGTRLDSIGPFLLLPDSVLAFDCKYLLRDWSTEWLQVSLVEADNDSVLCDYLYGMRQFQLPAMQGTITAAVDSAWAPGKRVKYDFVITGNFTGPCSLSYAIQKPGEPTAYARRRIEFALGCDKTWQGRDSAVIDSTWTAGAYTIGASLYRVADTAWMGDNHAWGGTGCSFLLRPAKLSARIVENLPTPWIDTARIAVNISPADRVVKNVSLRYRLSVCPRSSDDWRQAFAIERPIDSLRNGDTIVVPVRADQRIGRYLGQFALAHPEDSIDGIATGYSFPVIDFRFNKYAAAWHDTVAGSVRITNRSPFPIDRMPLVILPASGYPAVEDTLGPVWSDSGRLISLRPGSDTVVLYRHVVDTTEQAGVYCFGAFLLSHGMKVSGVADYEVPPPDILAASDDTLYSYGDTVRILLYNSGGCGAQVSATQIQVSDPYGNPVSLPDAALFLDPGQVAVCCEFPVTQAMGGRYSFRWLNGMASGGQTRCEIKTVKTMVRGYWADVGLATSQGLYFPADSVRVLADVRNSGALPLDHSLGLTISPYGVGPFDTTYCPYTQHWPYPSSDEVRYGCKLADGAVELTGHDNLYPVGNWEITIGGKGRAAQCSREALVRQAYRQGKNRGKASRDGEHFRSIDIAMAENGPMLLLSTTRFNNILYSNYPADTSHVALPLPGNCCELAATATNVFVMNADSGRIYRIGRLSNTIERSWPVPAPGGIVTADGSVFVVNTLDGAVLRYSENGDSIGCFGQAVLRRPADIAVDRSGKFYVSDSLGVALFDNAGTYLGRRGSGRTGRITVDARGYLYCKDLDSMRVVKYDENGSLAEWLDHCPAALAARNDTLLVAEISTDTQGDEVWGGIYENLGRNKGYTTIETGSIDKLKAIVRFAPEIAPNGGSVSQVFWTEHGLKQPWKQFRTYRPIDSLATFDFSNIYSHDLLGFDATLNKPDGAISPQYRSLSLTKLILKPGDPVWNDSIHVALGTGEQKQSTTNAGVMPDSGQFLLQGQLALTESQFLPGIAPRLFEVWGSPLVVTLSPDQPVYARNENAFIRAVLCNRADTTISQMHAVVSKGGATLADTVFVAFAPHAVCSLMVTCSDTAACVLKAMVTANALRPIERYCPLAFNVPSIDYRGSDCPDTVDCRPFSVSARFYNGWSRDVILHPAFCTSRDTIRDSLPLRPGYEGTAVASLRITQDETLTVMVPELTGLSGSGTVDQLPIVFGTKARLRPDTIMTTGVGRAYLDYHMVSTRSRQGTYRLGLVLRDSSGHVIDSSNTRHSLAGFDSIAGQWLVAPGSGTYRIGWRVGVDSFDAEVDTGSLALAIAPPNTVTIDSLLADPMCNDDGSVTVRLHATNHSAEPVAGSFRFESPAGYGRKDTLCQAMRSMVLRYTLSSPVDPGRYRFNAYVISGGDTVHSITEQLEFSPRLIIDSMPSEIIATTGDTVPLVVRVRNTGSAVSYDTLAFDLGESCDARRAMHLNPASWAADTTALIVPVDLEDQTALGSVTTPCDRRPLRMRINGYKITVAARLNQVMYRMGDSVRLTLSTIPANERPLFCRGNAIYQGQERVSTAYVSGYAHNAALAAPERITATGDSAVYVGKTLDCGPFDSARVRSEPAGTASIRRVSPDSVTTGAWSGRIASGRLCQYKIRLAPSDTVDRVVISRYRSGCQSDTVLGRFDSLCIQTSATWPFDPSQGRQANLFYGVYTNTGRGLWLNTAYVYQQNDSLTIIPDRQVYQPGDSVIMSVHAGITGTLRYRSLVTVADTLYDSISLGVPDTSIRFVTPAGLVAGSRYLMYGLATGSDTGYAIQGSVQYNIAGYQLHVSECQAQRPRYLRGDTVRVYVAFSSSHAYDLTVSSFLGSTANGTPSLQDSLVVPVTQGQNWLEISKPVPLTFSRGPASLGMSFKKGQLALGGCQAQFDVVVTDTVPPVLEIVHDADNTYDCQLPYEVVVRCQDSSGVTDTLFYSTGYGWSWLTPAARDNGVSGYELPAQPRGTIIDYYVTASDEFGNRARQPHQGYRCFHVLPALPPGDVSADTSARGVNLRWRPPREEIIFHRFNPEVRIGSPTALLVSAPYYPARMSRLSLWNGSEDTSAVLVDLFAQDAALMPGAPIRPEFELRDNDTAAGWRTWSLDTMAIMIDRDVYVGVRRPGGSLWGDGAGDAHRTVVCDNNCWRTDQSLGNVLMHAAWIFPGQPVLYQVNRAGSGGYGVIADSLAVMSFRDTTVAAEGRYRYSVKSLWTAAGLYAPSDGMAFSVDYVPPRIDDSLVVTANDSSIVIGATINDVIGVRADSIHPESGPASDRDSIVACQHWYHLPRAVKTDTLRFYLTASDSAGNTSRSPASGWHQTVVTGIAGKPNNLMPTCFAMGNAYPNPSIGACHIRYQTPAAAMVNLSVYNTAGQLVRIIEHCPKQPGFYQARWDGRSGRGEAVTSGIYFVKFSAGSNGKIGKIMILR